MKVVSLQIDTHLQQQSVKPGQEWFWTEAWQAAEREVESDLAVGRFRPSIRWRSFWQAWSNDLNIKQRCVLPILKTPQRLCWEINQTG